MAQDTEASQAPAILLDEVLLDAKLSRPTTSGPGVIVRDELIEKVRSSGSRYVGITAAAGYGKTTFLCQWADAEDRPVAYVSLDRHDDDPFRLMALLAAAYQQVAPDRDVVADVTGPGISVLGRAAPRFASILRSTESPFVLMLDDLHELKSADCHDVLGVAMSGVPDHSQFVTASRTEQPHIPRLRVSGELAEMGAPELSLSSSAAETMFAAQNMAISPEQASVLTERTEGWPVGLYLASLIAAETGGDPLYIAGDDRYLADYLYDQTMRRLPEETQKFLQRTAILDELSGALCDAVLQRSDSQRILRRLEDERMFLTPLDRRREWYRFHDLFREFLVGELRSQEPENVEDLHRRAADWYETNGAVAKAVEHLLLIGDREHVVELIAEATVEMYQTGQMRTVTRWLEAIGDEAIMSNAPLANLAGEIAALQGDDAGAERWLAISNQSSFEGIPFDGTASFESGRAILRSMMAPNGPDNMLADALFAVEQEGAGSHWRDGALDVAAQAYLLLGDKKRARKLLEETSRIAEANGGTDNFVVVEADLALLDLEIEQWEDAARHAQRALAKVDEQRIHDYGVSLLAFAAGARVAHQRGDLDETRRLLADGMRSRQFCAVAVPWLGVRGRLHLAKVCVALADANTARHLVREINDIFHVRPKLGLLVDEVEAFKSTMQRTAFGTSGMAPLTPAELRVLPYLQTHLTFPQIAERLYVSQNTIRTQVGSIYRKLGVGTRTDAVERAVEIGLVGN